MLLDLGLPPHASTMREGLSLLDEALQLVPGINDIVLTGQDEDAAALEAIRRRAFDFLVKPASLATVHAALRRASLLDPNRRANDGSRRSPAPRDRQVIGKAPRKLHRLPKSNCCGGPWSPRNGYNIAEVARPSWVSPASTCTTTSTSMVYAVLAQLSRWFVWRRALALLATSLGLSRRARRYRPPGVRPMQALLRLGGRGLEPLEMPSAAWPVLQAAGWGHLHLTGDWFGQPVDAEWGSRTDVSAKLTPKKARLWWSRSAVVRTLSSPPCSPTVRCGARAACLLTSWPGCSSCCSRPHCEPGPRRSHWRLPNGRV